MSWTRAAAKTVKGPHPLLKLPPIPSIAPPSNLETVAPPLGQGSYAVVYKVRVGQCQYAARKQMTLFHATNPEHDGFHVANREHALMVRARLSEAPNIVYALAPPSSAHQTEPGEVLEERPYVGTKTQTIMFDMEWAQMGNLREFISDNPSVRITEETLCWIGRQAFWGLDWLHSRFILHGDLKPDNILVFAGSHEPMIKLGDLGSSVQLAISGRDEEKKVERCITTHRYAAPEMLLVGELNPATLKTDIYSLGVTLMEASGTRHPLQPFPQTPPGKPYDFQMTELHRLRKKILKVENERFPVSRSLHDLFHQTTAFDPDNRPNTDTLRVHAAFIPLNKGSHIERWVTQQRLDASESSKKVLAAENKRLNVLKTELENKLRVANQNMSFIRENDSVTSRCRITLPERKDLSKIGQLWLCRDPVPFLKPTSPPPDIDTLLMSNLSTIPDNPAINDGPSNSTTTTIAKDKDPNTIEISSSPTPPPPSNTSPHNLAPKTITSSCSTALDDLTCSRMSPASPHPLQNSLPLPPTPPPATSRLSSNSMSERNHLLSCRDPAQFLKPTSPPQDIGTPLMSNLSPIPDNPAINDRPSNSTTTTIVKYNDPNTIVISPSPTPPPSITSPHNLAPKTIIPSCITALVDRTCSRMPPAPLHPFLNSLPLPPPPPPPATSRLSSSSNACVKYKHAPPQKVKLDIKFNY